MKKMTMIRALLLLMAIAPSVRAVQVPSLKAEIWTLNNRATVAAFLEDQTGEDAPKAKLGDFRLVDLDGDSNSELVVVVDYSGRDFFNHLFIYAQNGSGIDVQDIKVSNMESLASAIEDLDGDGRPELLLRRALTPYLGARPQAIWTAVFSLSEGRMKDHSADFPAFYENRVLPYLDRQLQAAKLSSDTHPYTIEVLAIERDYVLQAIGRIPKAGLSHALLLARSEDPTLRAMAVGVLQSLDDTESREALETLAQDGDAEVAILAQILLSSRSH
jgi:FG-GAP-like repeat